MLAADMLARGLHPALLRGSYDGREGGRGVT